MSLLDPELLAAAAALVLSYGAIIWRAGWRWVLMIGVLGGLAVGLLMLWSSDLNGQTLLGGLLQAVLALMVVIGLVCGAIVQGIDALRPNGGSFAFRAWGLAVPLVAITVFLVATA